VGVSPAKYLPNILWGGRLARQIYLYRSTYNNMVLQDHFRPPLSIRRHWHAFHNAWATYIASELNQKLPPNYFAEPNVQFGIEIDVAAFKESKDSESAIQIPTNYADEWTPPIPDQTIPFLPNAETV
jgi:hypothetical protein